MRNKKKRLYALQQTQLEFAEHQKAMKAVAAQKVEAEAKAQAEAKAKTKTTAPKKKTEAVHSHDLAAPEASKTLRKKSKPRAKKASK